MRASAPDKNVILHHKLYMVLAKHAQSHTHAASYLNPKYEFCELSSHLSSYVMFPIYLCLVSSRPLACLRSKGHWRWQGWAEKSWRTLGPGGEAQLRSSRWSVFTVWDRTYTSGCPDRERAVGAWTPGLRSHQCPVPVWDELLETQQKEWRQKVSLATKVLNCL